MLAVTLFGFVLLAGTAGYMLIEGWSAWDSFYMTTISVTTVGYREVHELSWAGQAWTAARRCARRTCGRRLEY